MNASNLTPNTDDADQFSRGSLNLTYQLIRPINPKMALAVRNIAGGTASIKSENKNADHFTMTLNSFEVREVVEAFMKLGEKSDLDPGQAVMAQALIDDWMLLAKKMISELPNE